MILSDIVRYFDQLAILSPQSASQMLIWIDIYTMNINLILEHLSGNLRTSGDQIALKKKYLFIFLKLGKILLTN